MTDTSDTGGPDESRLEQLDERIRGARSQADEAMGAPDEEPAEVYHESGDRPQSRAEDDQTIAPPG